MGCLAPSRQLPAEEETVTEEQPTRPLVGRPYRGLQVCSVHPLGGNSNTILVVSTGSVVDFVGDAIVNAANEGCITGGGVDLAVNLAGGPDLEKARAELPLVDKDRQIRCPTGEARVTIGGCLKVPYCIHAVGPNYDVLYYDEGKSLEEGDALVAKAYASAIECAQQKRVGTIAFALISASIFKGPQKLMKVLKAGIDGIQTALYPELQEVHLVAFKDDEREALETLCGEVLGYAQGSFGENQM